MTGPLAKLLSLGAVALAVMAFLGPAPLGRVLMAAGLSGAALPLLDDQRDRGEAFFHSGDFAQASAAFAMAQDDYNLGLASAWSGDYAAALVAWDRYIAMHPDDPEAKANHALITGLLAGTEFQPVADPDAIERDGPEVLADPGQGGARAAGSGDEANNAKTGFWMPEITSEGLRRVPQIFDAQFVAANQRWLATLEDQPGRYLKARLAAEQKARGAAGTARPDPEDPQ